MGNLPPPLNLPPQQNLPPGPTPLADEPTVSPLLHEARVAIHGVSGAATDGADGRIRGDSVAGDDVGCCRGRCEGCEVGADGEGCGAVGEGGWAEGGGEGCESSACSWSVNPLYWNIVIDLEMEVKRRIP